MQIGNSKFLMWIYSLTYDYYTDTWFWLNNITRKKKKKINKMSSRWKHLLQKEIAICKKDNYVWNYQ